ncbi:MAG: hypothetical protein ACO378_08460, partial [Sedimenticolaceae bacterium]
SAKKDFASKSSAAAVLDTKDNERAIKPKRIVYSYCGSIKNIPTLYRARQADACHAYCGLSEHKNQEAVVYGHQR